MAVSAVGRPKKTLVLTEEEEAELRRLARRPKSAQRLALRAKIVLCCAEGLSHESTARKLQCSRLTVGKWSERFRRKRLAGLQDEPRPGTLEQLTMQKSKRS